MMQRSLAIALTLPALAACSTADHTERPAPRLIEGQPIYDVLPRDGIPAIDEPSFVSAELAATFMRDDEPVIGVVGADGTAKCYSAWHLDEHEIVNDSLDGRAIAVTW